MFASPSHLPEAARTAIIDELNTCLADGLDLHGQLKVAHWNVKGPHFASLHPLFEQFAVDVAGFTDDIAERAVTLGGRAFGTARHVARVSRLPEYASETSRDLDHVRLLVDRFDAFLVGLRSARAVADRHHDGDTADLLAGVVGAIEKHAWFLRASLGH